MEFIVGNYNRLRLRPRRRLLSNIKTMCSIITVHSSVFAANSQPCRVCVLSKNVVNSFATAATGNVITAILDYSRPCSTIRCTQELIYFDAILFDAKHCLSVTFILVTGPTVGVSLFPIGVRIHCQYSMRLFRMGWLG